MIIIVDIDWNEFNNFRAALKRLAIQVDDIIQNGPAGGNPRFTLTIDDREKADAVMDLIFGVAGVAGLNMGEKS